MTPRPCSTSATVVRMTSVGLRELRQNASELIRRVEDGEEITVTVAGRSTARLVPAPGRQWLQWDAVADLFDGADDPDWDDDRALVDQELRDPWSGA